VKSGLTRVVTIATAAAGCLAATGGGSQTPPDDSRVCRDRVQYASLLSGRRRQREAEREARMALGPCEQALPESAEPLGQALYLLGRAAAGARRSGEAARLLSRAIAVWVPQLGDGHPAVVEARTLLARIRESSRSK
jgi:hypothetical protein